MFTSGSDYVMYCVNVIATSSGLLNALLTVSVDIQIVKIPHT